MAEIKPERPETYSLNDFEKSFGKLKPGTFIAFNDPKGDIPFGPIRQITGRRDENGCYPVALIILDPESGFQRVDKITPKGGFPIVPRLIPVTRNILPPIDEVDAKKILIDKALGKKQIDLDKAEKLAELPIPEMPTLPRKRRKTITYGRIF